MGFKKHGKNKNRPLVKADDDSVYAIVLEALGYGRFRVYCSDKVERVSKLRGNMIRRQWVTVNDILLCTLREGDSKLCDIERKYDDKEIKSLKESNHLSDDLLSARVTSSVNNQQSVEFESLL